jgi:hypothetical protein
MVERYCKLEMCRLTSYTVFLNSIDERASLKITDISALSKPLLPFRTNELFFFNDFYGLNYILKKYMGLPQEYKFKCVLQHGVSFYDIAAGGEFEQNLPAIITTSKYSSGMYSKYTNAKLYSMGTAIQYAESYYEGKKIKEEKERLGKNLLFFPVHSASSFVLDMNANAMIDRLLEIKKEYHFDSVTICWSWMEILMKKERPFMNEKYGFKNVTAGYLLDPMFFPRLKTIILLSDLATTNFIGSCLFYSIALNKPFYFLEDKSITLRTLCPSENENYGEDCMSRFYNNEDTRTVRKAFSTFCENLTDEQIVLRDKYCGISSFKTPEQFRIMIQEIEDIYRNGDYQTYNPETAQYYLAFPNWT